MTEEVILDAVTKNGPEVYKELKKNPTFVYLAIFSLLFFIAVYVIIKDKNDQIKKYEGQIEVWQKRQEDWITRRDELQDKIIELSKLNGEKQVLDSLSK